MTVLLCSDEILSGAGENGPKMKRTDPRIRSSYVTIFVATTGASLGTFAHSGKITAADLVIAVAIGFLNIPIGILASILLVRLMGLLH